MFDKVPGLWYTLQYSMLERIQLDYCQKVEFVSNTNPAVHPAAE